MSEFAYFPPSATGTGIISINGDTSASQLIVGGTGISVSTIAGTTTITNTEPSSGGTVTSVGLALPISVFTVSGSPVTVSGTLTGTLIAQTANTVWAGPPSGAAAAPTFRALVAGDIPTLPYATDSFTIMQTPLGTSPTATSATSTLTWANTDGTISITGNSGTDTITLGTVGLQPTGNYITALTGDVTASGPGSAVATLATVNSSPGTYTFATIAVNAKGLVTSASSGTAPVTSVMASAPLSSSGGTAPTISISQATTSTNGYLSSTDWNTFNNKQSALTFSDSVLLTGSTVTLVGDTASPGVSEYYGTDSLGNLGYHNLSVGAGANTSLSNLSAVAINTSLLPGVNNSIDLGSSSFEWAHLYIGTQILTPLVTALGATGAAIILRGGLAASAGAGGNITVTGAAGDSANGAGGSATLSGGAAGGAGGTNESGGAVSVTAGNSVGSATGGTVTVSSGNGGTGTSTAGATGGTTNVNGGTGGAGSSTSGNGGGATLKGGSGGNGVAGGQGGTAQVTGGSGGTGSASGGNGGAANLQGGNPASFAGAAGGTVTVAAGNGTGTGSGGAGGSVTINTGTAGGDNTVNNTGGSFTLSVGHSMGSSGGAQVQMTAGTGGVGTSTAGASGGAFNINAGAGGAGSSTGGGGGNVIIEAGVGGSSTTSGAGGFIQFQTASTTSLTEKMRILAAGGVNIVNGLLNITTAGNGLAISHGSNCKLGTSTLSSGSVVVSNTAVTSNSVIFLTTQSPSGTVGYAYISTKTAGTSFTIASTSASDNSTVAWMIVEQI